MVTLSRTIARWNGNHTGRSPINLITDDLTLAQRALTVGDQRHSSRKNLADNRGVFWPYSGVIWTQPHPHDAADDVRTLAHEMAHAIVEGDHNRRWRRMYAMLLPLWWRALRPWDGIPHTYEEATQIVMNYRKVNEDRDLDEINSLAASTERALDRWLGTVDYLVQDLSPSPISISSHS